MSDAETTTEATTTETATETTTETEQTTTGQTTDQGTQAETTTATTTTPDVGTVLGSKDWIKHVPTEFVATASKYDSLPAFLKAHGELQSKMGSAIHPPGKDARDEDVAKFHERLGRPKASEGYVAPEIDGVPLNDDNLAAFRERAFRANLTQAQFDDMVRSDVDATLTRQKAAQQAHEKAHKALTDEWGDEAEANYEMARRIAGQVLTAEERKALGIGDDPKNWQAPLAAAMARLAPVFSDDRHISRGDKDLGKADDALLAELDELQNSSDYYSNKAKQARANEISEALWGKEPITGVI